MSSPFAARACLAGAMCIVGSSVAVGKSVALSMPIHLALGLRFLVACALALPLLRLLEGGLPQLRLRHWGLLFLQTFCGVFLFNVLLLLGLLRTDAASAGVLTGTTPAWIAFLALIFLKERPGKRGTLGILLALAGTMSIAALNAGNGGESSLTGDLFVLGAVIGEAVFLLLRKALPASLSALTASTAVSCIGLAQFLGPAAWQAASFDFATLGLGQWLLLLYYGGAVSVLAYVLWFYGVARVPAATAGVYSGLMPVSALFFSWAFLDEPLGWGHVLGCICVLGGIALLSAPARRRSATGGLRAEC
ncbi:DMT family transporter [Desulfovibrio aminophilus]|uniref:DMT family transporter n=1 Tax=Desulfovibrio aminophilus TaxID=81425 RepID=UPI00040FB615|nr:DMT family transporter [Desulfovibrio aminophilus]